MFAAGSKRPQSSTAQGKSWDENTLAKEIVRSYLSEINRLASTRILRAFLSLMMYLGILLHSVYYKDIAVCRAMRFLGSIVDTVMDELGCTFLGCNVRVVILEEEGVGGLHAVLYDRGCIVLDGEIIRGRPGRTDKCLNPRYGVGDCWFDDTNKVLRTVHVIVDVMQEWKDRLLQGVGVIGGRLGGNKSEVIGCHCEDGGDFVGGSHCVVAIDREEDTCVAVFDNK